MAPRGQNRAKLVEAMRSLALRRGYSATGVDDVCAAAGVSKGSFYHHFSSKEDIAVAAVESYFGDVVHALTPVAGTGSTTEAGRAGAVDRLDAFLDRAVEVCSGPLFAHGSLLGVLTLDLSETHPDVRRVLGERFQSLGNGLAGLIQAAAVERGASVPAAALARQFLAVLEGALVLARAQDDRTVVAEALGLYHRFLDLLLDTPERSA